MILQGLMQFYDRMAKINNIPDFGFSLENVGFVLEIDRNGKLLQEHDIRQGEGKDIRPVLMGIPYSNKVNVRSVNIQPNFLVDKASYLLGNDQKTKSSRLKECYLTFVELLKDVLNGVEDEGAKAILMFYENWKPNEAAKKLKYWDDISSDKAGFIAFRLTCDRQYIHQRKKIQMSWQQHLNKQKSKLKGQCLLTGTYDTQLQQLHAQFKGIAGGQSSGKSLVSFNIKSSESYNKKESFNAPVSIKAEFKSSTALKTLIHSKKQHLYIGETFTVFWTGRQSEIEGMLGMILDPKELENQDNANIRMFLEAVREGKRPEGIDPDIQLYILGLSPNAARIAIRFWYTCSVGLLEDCIGQHYQDLQIIHSRDNDPVFPGIWRILRETVNKKSNDKTPAPLLAGAIMKSILKGTAYPQGLFNAVINRIRADQDINYVRAAILKAHLNRKKRINNTGTEVSMALNLDNKNQPYLLGRLFSVLEKVQQEALPGINATIKDRFWGAASSTPKVVFPQLMNLKNHHITKMDNKGRSIYLEKLIGQIMDEINSSGFPSHMTLDEQGLFAIGYYHQRQDLFKKKETEKNDQ